MANDFQSSPVDGGRAAARMWGSPYLLLTFTALFWAGNSIVARGAKDLVPPLALSFWRWTLALILLLPFAFPHLRRDARALLRSWRTITILGALGIGAFNTLLYTGMQSTSAVNGLLLQSLQPGLIVLLGAVVFAERTRPLQMLGIALTFIGALMIICRGDVFAILALRFNSGDVVIGCGVVIWSLYSVLLRKRPVVHPLSFLAATLVVGVICVTPLYIAEIVGGRLIEPRAGSVLAIGYVCVFPSLVAYLCYNRGVELLGSAAAGLYLNIMPVAGAVLASLFLGEAIRSFHLAGASLIGVGIACALVRVRSGIGTPRP